MNDGSTTTSTRPDSGTGAGTQPVNILLVDDQPGRLLTYRAILEPLHEHLIEATSGPDALRMLMENDCAMILLDVNMPGMDGFETASLIHQHPRYENTPIIFVSAVNVSDMDRLRGYKLGAVDYVMVPIIPEILRGKVMVLAELHRKRRALEVANLQLEEANIALQAEKMRELDILNESLSKANAELASSNAALRIEVQERGRIESRLRAQDRNKDEFLATLAHELRNPLAALSNAIRAQKLAPTRADDPLTDTMQRQVSLLVRLIDDLLDVARIAQDKLVLQRQPTTLGEILASAREIVQPLLDAGRHAVQLRQPEAPIALQVDPARLAQVFANLLSNAAKYSDPGTPIEIEVWQDAREIAVAVVDHGIGLTSHDAETVFERFRQVDAAIERSQGGLGIGLSLVKRIAELHGGRVSVASAGLGEGTRFTVYLPVQRVQSPQQAGAEASAAPAAATAGQSLRVLVVDDNRDSADTLALLLGMLGHEVSRCYDPHQVEALASAFHPDLVLLDLGMPGLSGYEVARLLRSSPRGTTLRLVAMTGWGQPDDFRRTSEAGFDAHLVKPVDAEALLGLIASWSQGNG